MLDQTEKARLIHKLSGFDDHELVLMRAGDVRALLTLITALATPEPIALSREEADRFEINVKADRSGRSI
ncbi:hypothetical protein [Puerhibacterium puerhi]|uniref:hypothetical protein n=1 Tax=Puerhibacterium puerhi TaxID=2692623 RepID=UPI00135A1C5D|nr:hypothetical protein [Puerhibacterium puerhi]